MMMLFHIWGCDLICFWKDVVCVWGSLSSSPYDIGCHKGVHSGSYDFTRLPLLLLHSIACKPSLEAAKIKSSLYSNNYFLWYAPWCPTPECSWIGTVLITWKGVRTCKVLTELRASFQLCGLLMCSLIRQSAPLQDSIKLQLSSRDPSASPGCCKFCQILGERQLVYCCHVHVCASQSWGNHPCTVSSVEILGTLDIFMLYFYHWKISLVVFICVVVKVSSWVQSFVFYV
jgi:hypothetical protein